MMGGEVPIHFMSRSTLASAHRSSFYGQVASRETRRGASSSTSIQPAFVPPLPDMIIPLVPPTVGQEDDDAASPIDLSTQSLAVALEEDTRASEVEFAPIVGQIDEAQV